MNQKSQKSRGGNVRFPRELSGIMALHKRFKNFQIGFFSGVEALRSQVTRAEARIAQLAERLATLSERNAS